MDAAQPVLLHLLNLILVTLTNSFLHSGLDSEQFARGSIDRTRTSKHIRNHFKLHPFAKLDAPDLIKFRGYPVEVHRVVTQDGFILQLHRIPYGVRPVYGAHSQYIRNETTGPPVLVQHGNFQSSVDWVLNADDDNCLPFLLANSGYDVWLGNFRGNVYSSKHIKYKETDPRYWSFSAHEMGVYDLSTMIDYILWVTHQRQVYYIGFSLSTTAFFMLLSHAPSYNAKVRLGVSLGTSVYQHHSEMLKRSCALISFLQGADLIAGSFPIPHPALAQAIRQFVPHLCNDHTFILIPEICWLFWSLSWGFDGLQIPKSRISLLLSKIPNSSSSKAAIHICQIVNSQAFEYYDYGRKKNRRLYGPAKPPEYNLGAVTAPVSLFYAPKDAVAPLQDIQLLQHRLPNVVDLYHVPFSRFNHIDFIFAKNAKELVYQHILETMSRF